MYMTSIKSERNKTEKKLKITFWGIILVRGGQFVDIRKYTGSRGHEFVGS